MWHVMNEKIWKNYYILKSFIYFAKLACNVYIFYRHGVSKVFSPRAKPDKSLFEFQLLGECHCWWTKESPRAHVAKFYGQLRLIRSVFRASKFLCEKFIVIVILWVYYTIHFGFTLFWHFKASLFTFLNYIVWLRITDEGWVPEMRIWSILLIKSDSKWCIHWSRSLFLNWYHMSVLLFCL